MIYVVASCMMDQMIYVDHLPKREEDEQVEKIEFKVGGCGYHVANAIKNCTLISPIGTGMYARMLEENIKNLPFYWMAPRVNEENGVCLCLIEKDGERTFLANHGAENHYKKEWLKEITKDDWVYICGIDTEVNPCIIEALEEIRPHVFFAPSSRIYYLKDLERIFQLHPIVHLNRSECDFVHGMEAIYKRTNNLVIMTDGDKGSYAYDGQTYFEPSVALQIKNAVGAGDTHAGACLKLLEQNVDVQNVLKKANDMASEFLKKQ